MKFNNKWILACALCLPVAAWADQCELISADQASEMMEYLKPNIEYVHFCEPCGDKDFYKRKVERVRRLQIGMEKSGNDTYWSVTVNGKGIDLAYTYIRGEDGGFLNLADLANCPTDGVSVGFEKNE